MGIRQQLFWAMGVGLVTASSIQGCTFGTRQIQSLQRIQQYPKTVTIKGVVGDRVPLVQGQVYELSDSSGTIWILSPNESPVTGTQLRVTGQVQYQPMPELGSGMGELYVKELNHEVIDP